MSLQAEIVISLYDMGVFGCITDCEDSGYFDGMDSYGTVWLVEFRMGDLLLGCLILALGLCFGLGGFGANCSLCVWITLVAVVLFFCFMTNYGD